MFVHLHGHSKFSLLEAIGSSKDIIQQLKKLGFSHAPMQNYNGMFSVINHYIACKKEEMQAIIGVDIAIQIQSQGKSFSQSRFITLIAKNYEGYLTLLDLVSQAQISGGPNSVPQLPISRFPQTNGNIFALVSAYETPLGDMISAKRSTKEMQDLLGVYKETFGTGNVILEIIPQDPKKFPQLAEANKIIRELHEITGLPIVATSNFHYIVADDKEAFDIALAIKDGKRMYEDDRRKTLGDFHIMSEDEIRAYCEKNGFNESQIETMLNKSVAIANDIKLEIPLHQLLFPVYETPKEIKELYDKFLVR